MTSPDLVRDLAPRSSNSVRVAVVFMLLAAIDSAACSSTVGVGSDVIADSPASDAIRSDASGIDDADSTLTEPAPRPVAPLSTSTVTTSRPTLRWALAADTDGVRVELCRDRRCLDRITGFDAHGSFAAPDTSLQTGTVFWRIAGTRAGAVVTRLSPTWQFTVGRIGTRTDTSWGVTPDVNGDGFADVIGGAPDARRVHVYLGGPSGPPSAPSVSVDGPTSGTEGAGFGGTLAVAGDVDGDGFADVIVGQWHPLGVEPTAAPSVYWYPGGPEGLSRNPSVVLPTQRGPDRSFGAALAGVGDVNGDGYADIAVGSLGAPGDPGTGGAYLYLGGPTGPATTPVTVLPTYASSGIAFVSSAGDTNGDGFGDVAVAASGSISVYLGGPSGVAMPPLWLRGADPMVGIGVVGNAGDMNGDGYADVVAGAYFANNGTGSVYVFAGGPSGSATAPSARIDGPDGQLTNFGSIVSAAGDLNGDGMTDLVVAGGEFISGGRYPEGRVHLYFGSPEGVSFVSRRSLTGPVQFESFGVSAVGGGDVDGDGLADIVIGAPLAFTQRGAAYVFRGASQISDVATWLIRGPDAEFTHFGMSVQ